MIEPWLIIQYINERQKAKNYSAKIQTIKVPYFLILWIWAALSKPNQIGFMLKDTSENFVF